MTCFLLYSEKSDSPSYLPIKKLQKNSSNNLQFNAILNRLLTKAWDISHIAKKTELHDVVAA
jgi:hypothetical protein